MVVTAVPFPTAILATHLAGPDRRVAALLFHGLVIAIFFNLLWRYGFLGTAPAAFLGS